MEQVLEAYKTAYHQMIDELAKNELTPEKRRFIIEMLYKTEMNISILEKELKI